MFTVTVLVGVISRCRGSYDLKNKVQNDCNLQCFAELSSCMKKGPNLGQFYQKVTT